MWLILRSSSVHPLILSCSARNLLIPRTPWCPATSGCLSALYLSSLECFYLPQYENGLFFLVLLSGYCRSLEVKQTVLISLLILLSKWWCFKVSTCLNSLLLGSKEVIQGLLGGLEVWFGLWPGGGENDREEENNAGQRRLPQHWGAKLSAAVWEWCDQRLLEGRAWRVAEAPSVKGKTSSLQMEYETWQAVYWSSFQTFFI